MFTFLFWLSGLILCWAYLIYFFIKKDDSILQTRFALFALFVCSLLPVFNIVAFILVTYIKLEHWFDASPFE